MSLKSFCVNLGNAITTMLNFNSAIHKAISRSKKSHPLKAVPPFMTSGIFSVPAGMAPVETLEWPGAERPAVL